MSAKDSSSVSTLSLELEVIGNYTARLKRRVGAVNLCQFRHDSVDDVCSGKDVKTIIVTMSHEVGGCLPVAGVDCLEDGGDVRRIGGVGSVSRSAKGISNHPTYLTTSDNVSAQYGDLHSANQKHIPLLHSK